MSPTMINKFCLPQNSLNPRAHSHKYLNAKPDGRQREMTRNGRGAELHSKPFFNISWGCKLRLQFIMTLLFIYICFAPLYHHFLLSIPLLHHHPTIINFASCRLPFFPFSILLSLYPTTFAPQSTHLPHCQPPSVHPRMDLNVQSCVSIACYGLAQNDSTRFRYQLLLFCFPLQLAPRQCT